MCHVLDKHIPVVNALDAYFEEFWRTMGVMPFSVTPHSGCRWASCEVLTATICQRASILQCLDRPIEKALRVVKNWGKTGKSIIGF